PRSHGESRALVQIMFLGAQVHAMHHVPRAHHDAAGPWNAVPHPVLFRYGAEHVSRTAALSEVIMKRHELAVDTSADHDAARNPEHGVRIREDGVLKHPPWQKLFRGAIGSASVQHAALARREKPLARAVKIEQPVQDLARHAKAKRIADRLNISSPGRRRRD